MHQGNVYGISETNPGFIFRFVPDSRGDLSSGQLYALEVVNPTGDRVGDAEWIPLDRTAVQVDANCGRAGGGRDGLQPARGRGDRDVHRQQPRWRERALRRS
jgi:hypothetical protein